MATPSLMGQVGLDKFNLGLGTIGNVMVWMFFVILICGAILGAVIFVMYRRMYNQNIYIFGMLGNKPTLKIIDKAKILRLGAVGDTLFQLRKQKKFIAPPTIQISPNTWWYWQRPDGELINFTLGDVDELMRKAGVQYVETDLRMTRLGIEKNLRDRFEKTGFWAKYGSAIMGLVFVIMVTIALVVLFSKLVDVANALELTASAVNNMATNVALFYDAKIEGGISDGGLRPANVSKTT